MAKARNDQQAIRAAALAQDLRAVVGRLKRRMRDGTQPNGLTPSQASILSRLEEGAATASGLARAEGMRPQSVAPLVAALEQAGLVHAAPDPADGRRTLLSLTEACRARLEEARAARQDWLTRALQARLSPQEQDAVANAVALLGRLVDD